jgi:hypothetical protein
VFDPGRLRDALHAVSESAWSLPSTFAETGVHHGYRRVVYAELDPFRFVFDEFEPVHDAWLSWIGPDGFIVTHTDRGPHMERWQVPVSTSGWMEQNGMRATAVDGVPFRVEQWLPHAVGNPTTKPRIHLVIDRAAVANPDPTPFWKETDATNQK